MSRIINNLILSVLTCSALPVKPQSLQELINKALENNYQVKITRNEARIAENNNSMGAAGGLPSVDVSGSAGGSSNNMRQEFADGSTRQGNNAQSTNISFSALASWTIFDGFRVHAKKDQLGLLESIGQENARFYLEQTISDLVLVYYQLLYEQQLLANYRQSMEISAFRLSVETKRRFVGAGQGIAFRQAEVDFRSDSIRVMGQENAVDILQIELNRIVGENLENKITASESGSRQPERFHKDSLLRALGTHNSRLLVQQLEEMAAETSVRMERADRYPKISLFAGYEYNETSAQVGFFKTNRTFGPTLGLRVSFNLYNGGNTRREVRNAVIAGENVQMSRGQLDNDLQAEMLKYYSRHVSVQRQHMSALDNVKAMKEVYDIAAEQLRQGAINGYDFRLTQASLLNAELTEMQLRFILKSIEINMNRLSGAVVKSYL